MMNMLLSLIGSRTNWALMAGLLSVVLKHFHVDMDLSWMKDGLQATDVGTVVSMIAAMYFRANPKWAPPAK